jgi:isopenicillin N synthase-like dioxygenase
VIDLSSYDQSTPSGRSALARDLRRACESVGFFFLDGHGVPPEVIERAFSAAAAFFALSDADKQPCRASAATKNRGWTPPEAETLDPARQKARGDLKEGFYVGREIPADSRMAALPLHGPNVWPPAERGGGGALSGFRAACESYHSALTALAARLLPAVAEAAQVEDAALFVDAVFGEHGGGEEVPWSSGPMAFVRLLQYQPVPSDVSKGCFGCGAHTDWGMLTFLATDASPGLQVLRRRRRRRPSGGGGGGDEETTYWQDVPPRPGSFVVNVGDMLERWTAGRMRSTVHRVVVPARATSAAAADADADADAAADAPAPAPAPAGRRSIAFFLDPSYSALIAPPSGSDPSAYPATRAGAYLLSRYRETHAGFE